MSTQDSVHLNGIGKQKRIRFKPLPVRRLCLCAGGGLCRFVTNPTLLYVQDAISWRRCLRVCLRA